MSAFSAVVFVLAVLAVSGEEDSGWIIGGTDVTEPGKYPHQGSLNKHGQHSCGCSLISEDWVLTAAHCVDSLAKYYSVYLGINKLSERDEEYVYHATEIIQHRGWGRTRGQFPNDIALVRLDRPAKISETVQPIKLAPADASFVGKNCKITGWGKYMKDGRLYTANALQEANTTVITREECGELWDPSYLVDGHLCVFNDVTGACSITSTENCTVEMKSKIKDGDQGDSGGPLVCDGVLAGVTSWGSSQCSTYLPTVYTDVAYFRQWIQKHTGI